MHCLSTESCTAESSLEMAMYNCVSSACWWYLTRKDRMRPASGATYIANSLSPSDDHGGTPVSTVGNVSSAAARRVIGMVRRQFKRLDTDDFQIICKTYMSPHLKYCIQAWSPYLVKDVAVMENVQKAATNLVPKSRKYSYRVRLQKLGLTTLKDRRERNDMIEMFKFLSGRKQIDIVNSSSHWHRTITV